MTQRQQLSSAYQILTEITDYTNTMFFLNTDDKVLYQYKRKLQKEMEWILLKNQIIPVMSGAFLFLLTRRLASKSKFDFQYFLVPYLYLNYGTYLSSGRQLYEMGYPAHPFIVEQRTKVLNRVCFKYPQILKNEIEYLHTKIHDLHEEASDEELVKSRYEKVFQTGEISTDY